MTSTADTRSPLTTRGLIWTWVVLVAITIAAWWLAPAHSTGTVEANAAVTVLILVLTFVKCRLIVRNFMEVRDAPRWLAHVTDAWLALLLLVIFVIYLF